MCATFIPCIPGLSSFSTINAQSQRGAFPCHSGQDQMRSRRIPWRPHSSLGAKKEAMALWKTEILPSITGHWAVFKVDIIRCDLSVFVDLVEEKMAR